MSAARENGKIALRPGRRALRLAAWLLIVVLLVVAAVQVVLWTDLPRQQILAACTRRLGADTSAEGFRTTWGGTTALERVSLTLPLAERPVLMIDEMTILHRSLPGLLITRKPAIQSVTVRGVTLELHKDRRGRWNLAQLLAGLPAAADDKTGSPSAPPALHVEGMTVVIIGDGGRREAVGPLHIEGRSTGPITWAFEASVPNRLDVGGRIGCVANWPHEVRFDARGLDPVCTLLAESLPPGIAVRGAWTGQYRNGAVTGLLEMDALEGGPHHLSGEATIEITEGQILVAPERLRWAMHTDATPLVELTGGYAKATSEGFAVSDVTLTGDKYTAEITAFGTWADGHSAWEGVWAYADPEKDGFVHGTLRCELHAPGHGLKRISASATLDGRTAAGELSTSLHIQGHGVDWRRSQWTCRLQAPEWSRDGERMRLDSIEADLEFDGTTLWLRDVDVPTADLARGRGYWSPSDPNWLADIELTGVRLGPAQKALDLRLSVSGDGKSLHLTHLDARRGGVSLLAAGAMDLPSTELRDVEVTCTMRPEGVDPNEPSGELRTRMTAQGTIAPANLNLTGSVSARRLAVHGKPVPDIHVPFQARLDQDRLAFECEAFDYFGGRCHVSGGAAVPPKSLDARVSGQSLVLEQIARLVADSTDLEGTASVDVQLTVPLQSPAAWAGKGRWRVEGVRYGAFRAETGGGRLAVSSQVVAIEDSGLQSSRGRIAGDAKVPLAGGHIEAAVDIVAWPVQVTDPNLAVEVSGNAVFAVDLGRHKGAGTGTFSAEVMLHGSTLGVGRFAAATDGESLEIDALRIETLGGHAKGKAHLPFKDWYKSRLDVRWEDLDLSMASAWWPFLEGMEGVSNGTLHVAPADEPRAFEPLCLTAEAAIRDGRFRGGTIGDGALVAYAGPNRIVLSRGDWDALGGHIRFHGSRMGRAEATSHHLLANIAGVQLNQLVRSIHPQANPVPGTLDARVALMGTENLSTLTGNAVVQLSEAELIGNTVISALYAVLDTETPTTSPSGVGHAELHLAGTQLSIDSFYYRSRGTEVRGVGQIENLTLGPASPVSGYAFGVDRPLHLPELFGLRELDRLMAVIQKNAVTAEIEGTLGEPRVRIVPLAQVGGQVRRFVASQLGTAQ